MFLFYFNSNQWIPLNVTHSAFKLPALCWDPKFLVLQSLSGWNEWKGVFLWMTAAAWQRLLSVCHLRPFTHRRQAVFFGRRRPLTCTAMKAEAIQAQELFTIMAIHLWMQHVSPITGSHYDSRRKIKCVLQQIIWTCTVKIINQPSCWANGSVFYDITHRALHKPFSANVTHTLVVCKRLWCIHVTHW